MELAEADTAARAQVRAGCQLQDDERFYLRCVDGKLNLKAQILALFAQIARAGR